MDGLYKIAVASPRLVLGNAAENADEIDAIIRRAAASGVAAIAFPELSVTGYTCGDMFFRRDLAFEAESALRLIADRTASLPIVSIVGFPQLEGDAVFNAAAVLFGGEITGVVRKRALPTYGEYYESRQFTPAPADDPNVVFDVGGLRFAVEICEDLWSRVPPSSVAASAGVDVVFNLSASTDFLGKAHMRREMVRGQSLRLGCTYAMACAGLGESGSDAVFGGGSVIASGGKIVAERELFADSPDMVCTLVDVESARYRRRSHLAVSRAADGTEVVNVAATLPTADSDQVSPSPFLDEYGVEGWERVLTDIQGAALAKRLRSARAERLVIGVSGGADSALALLGSAAAVDRLGRPRTDIVAVVMPGPGSTGRTQKRAAELAAAVGATVRTVDISGSCMKHLAEIGHAPGVKDIAFENAQARERTQILMDIANMENALVVGTGDLSEVALGWNTYAGDHISMYQINASVPKTMVLGALRGAAKASAAPLSDLLAEIADAPITPELVPGAADNDTEARIGPYELHDFFLYHYIANGASSGKMLVLAKVAFRGRYDDKTIGETMNTFLRRFKITQYKRNCVPDGPKITLSLSPRADWRMPSDLG